MRRLLAVAVAGLLCLVVAGPVAAKGPPTITRLEPTFLTADDLAGTCDFPVELVDSFTNAKAMEFPADTNGDQLLKFTGGYRSTITNLESGESLDIKYFGNARYVFHADGTIDIKTGGTILYWIYPEDVLSAFDPGIYLITGQANIRVDAATFFALQPEQVTGRIVDLCAALS